MPHTARHVHLDARAVALLLACCMFWGFQQVPVKATVAEVAPVFQAALRFAVALVLLWGWCLWRNVPLWQRDGSLGPGLLAGALFAGEFACVYTGLQFTHASRLTVFLYASPFWVALLLPRFVQDERLRGAQWADLACAFCGVLLALGFQRLRAALHRHPGGRGRLRQLPGLDVAAGVLPGHPHLGLRVPDAGVRAAGRRAVAARTADGRLRRRAGAGGPAGIVLVNRQPRAASALVPPP